MQKCIQRGLEREAMEFAVELMHMSRAFHTMVCNRLEVICHEDLDTLSAPWIGPFVASALTQSKERCSKSIGEARLMVGNAIRMMARAEVPALAATLVRPSGFDPCLRALRRGYRTTPSTCRR